MTRNRLHPKRSPDAPGRLRSITIAAASVLGLSACGGIGAPQSTTPAETPEPRQLFGTNEFLSSSARFGDLVWTAGHLPDGVSENASIDEQVTQVLDNLEATLEASGAGFDTLLKANIYLLDWDDWEAFNRIYTARIGRHELPPRTTVQVAHIGLGYRIEMEMVAYVRLSAR